MALRGNLKDFSLPDVFQLVQLSGKTGVLRITGPDAEGSIWFRDGDVFFAQSNWRRDQLGERLVTAQKITPAALGRALEMRQAEPEGGRRLGQILVAEGYITQQVLEAFVQEQIQDTIFDIMRWDEGDFDFEVLPDTVHEDIGLAVSVENIVMEGSRRLEEWNRIKKKVPSTEMVFKMATAPGEGTFEISLKPIEWNLLLLVDGTRTVRDLAVETRRTDFEVARVIYGLFSAGLLEVASAEEVEKLKAERAQREGKRAKHEAARRARDEAQQAEALELESKLAAEAEARRAASAAEPTTVPPQEAPEVPVTPVVHSTTPAEEPEFLSAGVAAASADDMAVFEQMMEAVLAPQAPTAPTPVSAFDEDTPAALTPTFAPDVLTDTEVLSEPEPELAPEPEPELAAEPESVSEPEPEPVPEPESESKPAPESEPEPEPELAAEPESVSEPEIAPEPEPVSPSGFDSSAGLGQADAQDLSDLLLADDSGLTAAVPVAEAVEALYEFGPEIEVIPPAPVTEPASIATPEGFVPTGDFETDLRTLGLGEYPEELLEPEYTIGTEYSADIGVETAAPGLIDLQVVDQEAPESTSVDLEVDAEEDLDALLASLEPASAPGGRIASDTDFGIEEPTVGGVISTDAFLAEFDSGVSLGGGLGDELTALTGGGSARNRPVATVSKLPDEGESHMLQRDQLVDRSLLMKIIDGIEKL